MFHTSSLRSPLAQLPIGLVALLLVVTACASTIDTASEPASTGAGAPATEPSAAPEVAVAETPVSSVSEALEIEESDTRVVDTMWGPVEIPANPKTIVSVDEYAATNLLAFGVEPSLVVATYSAGPQAEIISGYGIEMIPGSYGVYNFEEIAARRPDLIVIVGNEETEEVFGQLSEIAPTVVIPFVAPWREIVTFTGALLDRESEAVTLITNVETQIEAIATDLGDGGPTISILANSPGFGVYSLGQGNSVSNLIEEAGFVRPESEQVSATVGLLAPVSEELVGEHDADLIVLLGGGDPFFEPDFLRNLEVFKALPAVAAGRTAEVVGPIWTGTGPFSVYWVLQDLQAAHEGTFATGIGTASDVAGRWESFAALTAG